jgi:hypothetical protein
MRRLQLLMFFIAIALPQASVADQQVGADQILTGGETTETNRAPIIPFLEGTDVFWTLVKKDALDDSPVFLPNKLEANIFPHLVFYQNFTDILDIDRQAQRAARQDGGKDIKETAMVFSGTPAVRIRMLRDRSAPVRTPSYMPRGNFQFLWVRGLKDGTPSADRDKPRGLGQFVQELRQVPRISIWEFHVIGGHHSNGQDGCLSTDQELAPPPPAPNAECMPAGLAPTAKTMNRIDGSFSSAFFFRFGGNYTRNWMRRESPASASEPPQAYREARLSAEYEWHPRPWVDDQMRDIYGRHRVNLGAAYATRGIPWCQKRFEVAAGAVWNPGVVDPELDWSGHVETTCFPWLNGGWGFLVRWFAGQDSYNIGFLDDINRLHVGVTFNQADFFRFRRRPAKTNE